jgi:hypothetical protein
VNNNADWQFSWLDMIYYVQIEMAPLSKSMDEDLAEAAKEVEVRFRLSSLFFILINLLMKMVKEFHDLTFY